MSKPRATPKAKVATTSSSSALRNWIHEATKPGVLVPASGASGGLCGAMLLVWQGSPFGRGGLATSQPWLAWIAFPLFGALAATIFIFVVSNTDRNDRLRLAGLSLLAGMAWEPVLEAGKLWVVDTDQDVKLASVFERLDSATAALEEAAEADSQIEREDLTRQAVRELQDVSAIESELKRAPDIRAVRTTRDGLFDRIRALEPQIAAEAARELARPPGMPFQ